MSRDGKMLAAEPEENELRWAAEAADAAAAAEREQENSPLKAILATMLAQLEANIMVEGVEAALRAMIARNFPDVAPPIHALADSRSDDRGAPATPLKSFTAEQVNLLLGLLNCIQALDGHARRSKPDSAQRRADEHCRDFLRGLSDDLKAGTVSVKPKEALQ